MKHITAILVLAVALAGCSGTSPSADSSAERVVADRTDTESAEVVETTTTAAPTTTTRRPTTTTTPKVENWNYDESYEWNMANLVGTSIDDDLQWQIDGMDEMLESVDHDLDERYWATYIFYADKGCDLFDGFIQIGIDQNWNKWQANSNFEMFADILTEDIQTDGQMSWVDQEGALAILAAGMTTGGCRSQWDAFYEFVSS